MTRIKANGTVNVAVQLDHIATAGLLVQTVNILGDERELWNQLP